MVSLTEFSFDLACSVKSHWFAIAFGRMFNSDRFALLRDAQGDLLHVMAGLGDGFFISCRGFVTLEQLQLARETTRGILMLDYVAVDVVSSELALEEVLAEYGIRVRSREGLHEIAVCRAWLQNNMAVFDVTLSTGSYRFGLYSVLGIRSSQGLRIFGVRTVNTNVVPTAVGSYTSSLAEKEFHSAWFVGWHKCSRWALRG